MKRKSTLINTLKSSINNSRDSEMFAQNIYESSSFNASGSTIEDMLDKFYTNPKNKNDKTSTFFSDIYKDNEIFGKDNATEFRNTKLKWK